MKAVIIGAGRGSRLQHQTDEIPKALVPVMGRPMLDWILDGFAAAGISRANTVFVCGYAEEVVRQRYPDLTFVRNTEWEHNNVLASLLCAEAHFGDGFISSYADIVYEPAILQRLLAAPEDLVLGCDTKWRRRYVKRTQHPETDAEKLSASGRRVTLLSRRIPSEQADGEFIGVLKASPAGARRLSQAYAHAKQRFAGGPYREGRTFERAYLIDLLAELLESEVPLYRENTAGGYMELDTLEDLSLAEEWWTAFRQSQPA